MGGYRRKLVGGGVQLIGGCCGTTPDHIRAMKSALRVREARGKTAVTEAIHSGVAPSAPASIPLAERSRLGAKIAAGECVTMGEIVPPKGIDIRNEVQGAKFLK